MELTLDQALQKAVEAHKAGKVKEADQYYTAILKANPKHCDANHKMGVLAVGVGKVEAALPFFKTALEASPSVAQYWLSYIDALIKLDRIVDAKAVLDQAKNKGINCEGLDSRSKELQLSLENFAKGQDIALGHWITLTKLLTQQKFSQAIRLIEDIEEIYPDSFSLNNLAGQAYLGSKEFKLAGRYLKRAISLNAEYGQAHNNLGQLYTLEGKKKKAIESYKTVLQLNPNNYVAHNNLGSAYNDQKLLNKAIKHYKIALQLNPNYKTCLLNFGLVQREKGQFTAAIKSFKQAIELDPQYVKAFNGLGVALLDKAEVKLATQRFLDAIKIDVDCGEAYWNLMGTSKNIQEAQKWLSSCLKTTSQSDNALLMEAGLEAYMGETIKLDKLYGSKFADHPYTRSFAWARNLPKLPPLYFTRWALFDYIISLSNKDRPFYEFGVWTGEAFKYLIKTFKKGYGFDTFEGLPEDWHNEKAGTYSSDCNIPKIKGGKFIVGKFEDTLPAFFEKERPKASIINFDADLYSSTICALNFAKPVIDQHTILIFDEFLINDHWEQDEYKALEEFCSNNGYTYEVLAISFFTKQVAVKLIGI